METRVDPAQARATVAALRDAFGRTSTKSEPRPEGRRLATIPRGRDGELRLSLEEFEGKLFLSLRLWQRLEDGAALPSKKGISIRLHELPAVITGLLEAAEFAHELSEREGGSE